MRSGDAERVTSDRALAGPGPQAETWWASSREAEAAKELFDARRFPRPLRQDWLGVLYPWGVDGSGSNLRSMDRTLSKGLWGLRNRRRATARSSGSEDVEVLLFQRFESRTIGALWLLPCLLTVSHFLTLEVLRGYENARRVLSSCHTANKETNIIFLPPGLCQPSGGEFICNAHVTCH